MKQIVSRVVFNPAAKTITLPEFDRVELKRLLLVVDVTIGATLYSFAKGGASVNGNVVTLPTVPALAAGTDEIQVHYNTRTIDPQADRLIVGNARNKFRDGFADVTVPQPDPAVWDLVNDYVDSKSGHIVSVGGNSSGASYLRISLSPFVEDSEVSLTSKRSFSFPFRLGWGLSLSQRIPSQEVFVGIIGAKDGVTEYSAPVADRPLTTATIVVSASVATATATNHGLHGGDRVVLMNCLDRRLDAGPVVVTPTGPDTFTYPTNLAPGTYTATGGVVRWADQFRYAKNGFGLLHETTTATGASVVSRRNESSTRSLATNVASTVAGQGSSAAYTDALQASSNFELYAQIDEVAQRSYSADSTSGATSLTKFTQAVPEEERDYKIQIRARNLASMTRPVARIASITKSGTTTATVTTDVPHGLTTSDYVQIYGVRDGANFGGTGSQVLVLSTPTATTFTLNMGAAATATSAGGIVLRVENSALAVAVFGPSVATVSRANGIMNIVGANTFGTLLGGEFVQFHGAEPAAQQYEGAYKVLRVNGPNLEVEAPGPDFASIQTGGAIIKRTDVRLHYVRLMDYTRHMTEIVGGKGNSFDQNNSVPVVVAGAATAAQGNGTGASIWNAGGFAGTLQNDVTSSAVTASGTTGAITPGLTGVGNIGTYAQSFNVSVTTVTGTTPTLDVGVEESMDNGSNWVRIYDFPRITANGIYTSPLLRAAAGTRYRYVQTVGGTTPSFTRGINRVMYATAAPLLRHFFDRSIVLTTANSVTPTYTVDGADQLLFVVNMGAATTAPVLTPEGSEDGANWYPLGTATLTAVASSTAALYVTGVMPKFVRARVSTVGAGVTPGYVSIKAIGS